MPSVSISNLPVVITVVPASDLLPLVSGGITTKVTPNQLFNGVSVDSTIKVFNGFGRGAPVTKTTAFTVGTTENFIIVNGTASVTVTLPSASTYTGREISIKTIAAFTVISASSNVVPITSATAGTSSLAATAGKCATLVSDGTNWVIMCAN